MLVEKNKKISLEEFNQLDETNDITYELINGVVLMTPRPNNQHQRIQTKLIGELYTFFKDKTCKLTNEAELQLDDNVLVPDIFIYCDPNKIKKQRHEGAPTITIEIVSPSNVFDDYNRKYQLYKKYDVKEYWIVNPWSENIAVHNFENNTIKEYAKTEVLLSDVFEDMAINLNDVFED